MNILLIPLAGYQPTHFFQTHNSRDDILCMSKLSLNKNIYYLFITIFKHFDMSIILS